MSDILNIIASSFLFDGVDFSKIDAELNISESIHVSMYSAGELILSSEKHTDALCFIESGKLKITSDTGDRETILKYSLSGEIFGAASLFSSVSHYTKVYAECESRIIFLDKDIICKLFQYSPAVSINYIKFLSDKVAFLNRKVTAFTAGTAETKLAMFLYGNMNDSGAVIMQTSMTSLAEQLGIGRASLYRAIDSLANMGISNYNGKMFKILDSDALLKLIQ